MMAAELAAEPAIVFQPWPGEVGVEAAQQRARQVLAAYAAGDPPGWTSGCGRPHPLGGFTHRSVTGAHASIHIDHHSAGAVSHRADGPAVVEVGPHGPTFAAWRPPDGQLRTDGPQIVTSRAATARTGPLRYATFVLAGGVAVEDSRCYDRFAAMLAAGAPRPQALTWLPLGSMLGHTCAETLRTAGAQPEQMRALWEGGVEDLGVFLAVAAGTLPASWAIAGA